MATMHDLKAAKALGLTTIKDFNLFLERKEQLLAAAEQEALERENAGRFSTYDDYARTHK